MLPLLGRAGGHLETMPWGQLKKAQEAQVITILLGPACIVGTQNSTYRIYYEGCPDHRHQRRLQLEAFECSLLTSLPDSPADPGFEAEVSVPV